MKKVGYENQEIMMNRFLIQHHLISFSIVLIQTEFNYEKPSSFPFNTTYGSRN